MADTSQAASRPSLRVCIHRETVSTAFEADNVPKELRARFMKQGHVPVEGADITGLRRYLGREHIEGMYTLESEDGVKDAVRLRETRAELLRA